MLQFHKIIKQKSNHVIKSFEKNFKKMNLKYKIFLFTTRKKITLLKSPHINKSAREQFQFQSHKCTLFFKDKITLIKNKIFNVKQTKSIKSHN
jgi:ribosomal protein S10